MRFLKYAYSLLVFILGSIRISPEPNKPIIINIIGDLHSESGLGSVTREIIRSIDGLCECRCVNLPLSLKSKQQIKNLKCDSEGLHAGINLFIGNPEILLRAFLELNSMHLLKNYNIGLWFWELELVPRNWVLINNVIDEVWVQSKFVEDTFSPEFKNIALMPFSLSNVIASNKTRKDLGLPNTSFSFIFTFDFLSHISRKNPEAVINAFMEAFGHQEDVALVIKSVNANKSPEYYSSISEKIKSFNNIYLIDGYFDAPDLYRMIELSDCYVSLHKSEGLGLGMAEAMKLGTLVIATAYSGNLSFMNQENSLLVNYSRIGVKKNEYPYAAESYWAEPDINDASKKMKIAYEDKALREQLVNQAKLDVSKYTSANQRIWIEDRLRQIQ